jgi:hypothetical protein
MSEYTDYILKEQPRFKGFPGARSIGQMNASVTFVARYVIEECQKGLPKTVTEIIDGAYQEKWFVKHFYAMALAEMVFLEWVTLNGENISEGPKFADAVKHAQYIADYTDRAKANQEKRNRTYNEGWEKAFVLLPKVVQESINSGEGSSSVYAVRGSDSYVSIDNRNYNKRVKAGTECLAEFGKRHFYYDSKESGRREEINATWYVPAVVVTPGKHRQDNATVKINDELLHVEAYRIGYVKR